MTAHWSEAHLFTMRWWKKQTIVAEFYHNSTEKAIWFYLHLQKPNPGKLSGPPSSAADNDPLLLPSWQQISWGSGPSSHTCGDPRKPLLRWDERTFADLKLSLLPNSIEIISLSFSGDRLKHNNQARFLCLPVWYQQSKRWPGSLSLVPQQQRNLSTHMDQPRDWISTPT